MKKYGFGSADAMQIMAEAEKYAYAGRCTPYASSDAPPPPHIVWFVDDADELFDPFRTDEQALSFTH